MFPMTFLNIWLFIPSISLFTVKVLLHILPSFLFIAACLFSTILLSTGIFTLLPMVPFYFLSFCSYPRLYTHIQKYRGVSTNKREYAVFTILALRCFSKFMLHFHSFMYKFYDFILLFCFKMLHIYLFLYFCSSDIFLLFLRL